MPTSAHGSFQVEMKPLSDAPAQDGVTLGRLSLKKVFKGDLAATGDGEMLTATTATPGSAGYVAIERVSGSLHGRSGSFVLQHTGVMTRGAPSLNIQVVPDSGTGELQGLSGQLLIKIEAGKHHYELVYELPG